MYLNCDEKKERDFIAIFTVIFQLIKELKKKA